MPEQDPLADVITLLAAPISGAVRSIEQFRAGVDEFLRGIENFNRTMENLNETAERMNVLLGEVEEPIKAAVPQVTRAINNADEVMQVVSGPAMAAAPGLARLADTMNSPTFQQLPDQIATFSDILVDMSTRIAPLTQLAESAGGLFGLRMPGARPAGQRGQSAQPGGEAVDDAGDEAAESVPHGIRATVRTKAPPQKKTAKKASATRTAGSKKTAAPKKTAVSKARSSKKTKPKKTPSKVTSSKATKATKATSEPDLPPAEAAS
jgi:hypothetical protein